MPIRVEIEHIKAEIAKLQEELRMLESCAEESNG